MKILIVEDDNSLRELMKATLEKELHRVETAADYNAALLKIEDYEYDCVLLDVMLPGGNGLDLLKHLKELKREAAVIVVSAKDSLEDKVSGLDLGADDYLAKPFHVAELCARVRSVARRKHTTGANFVEMGNVKLFPDTRKTLVNDNELELLRKEFDILYFFLTRPNHVINKTSLAEAVWGDYIDTVDNYDFIYAQMKNLRKKLLAAGASVEIKAVYGFGYKLITL